MAGQPDENHDRVERIIQQILGSDRMRESSAFSQRSYSDEPILRTGADLRLRCMGCQREIMVPRFRAERNIRSIIPQENLSTDSNGSRE